MTRKIRFMETILRDGQQSQIATRMPIEDMLPVLEDLDSAGYYDYILSTDENSDLGCTLIREFSKDSAFGLREVYHKKPSLEEIFMAATRRSWEQTSELPDTVDKNRIRK